jgi:hypothetical protein
MMSMPGMCLLLIFKIDRVSVEALNGIKNLWLFILIYGVGTHFYQELKHWQVCDTWVHWSELAVHNKRWILFPQLQVLTNIFWVKMGKYDPVSVIHVLFQRCCMWPS